MSLMSMQEEKNTERSSKMTQSQLIGENKSDVIAFTGSNNTAL